MSTDVPQNPNSPAAAASPQGNFPPLIRNAALFLDLDGSLIEIAARPDEVRVPAQLPGLLAGLRDALAGAVAIVSGRTLEDIDRLLTPLRLAGAGVHGAQLRVAPQAPIVNTVAAGLGPLLQTLRASFAADPRILIEDKGLAVALHYRGAPERGPECVSLMTGLGKALGLNVKPGRMVLEALPSGPDKGAAVRALIGQPPFAGRVPIYIGDDVTDEDGIAAAQALGGDGIKVGELDTCARYRLPNVPAVHAWLDAELRCLRRSGG